MLTPVTNTVAQRTSTRSYPGTREQVGAVRADLRPLLAGCPHADDIILSASELAANAAIHSNSAEPGGTIRVHMTISHGERVHIEVRDDGGPWRKPAADADRPHGLDLVRALASGWGIVATITGRTVWAQFDWPTA